ncbi:hypothetical protein GCM10022295_44100 [Streptomyces osmaniensis]|uniref:Uncharacterized protein n=1 Tax=Streptomyces osmaniensis TaxID=593134 RepID=A0ABP6WXV9_9ACTN
MASRTAWRVGGSTGRVSFSTWETVATDTPARRATSAMVAIETLSLSVTPRRPVPGRRSSLAGKVSHPQPDVNACAIVYVLSRTESIQGTLRSDECGSASGRPEVREPTSGAEA